MVLKIRLARFGSRRKPFYNIVVAQARYLSDTFNSLSQPAFISCFIIDNDDN